MRLEFPTTFLPYLPLFQQPALDILGVPYAQPMAFAYHYVIWISILCPVQTLVASVMILVTLDVFEVRIVSFVMISSVIAVLILRMEAVPPVLA